jgi:hypothetical protein
MDVRAKQLLSYLACPFNSKLRVGVSPHVISAVGRITREMKLITILGIILTSSGLCCAQKPEFSCTIATLNLDSGNSATIEKQHVNEIAHFNINETMEEEPILKFFRLPKTRWFAVFRLYTSDESMLTKSGIGSIDLELSFARTRRRNLLTSPASASAETPFKTFDIVRVTTVARLDNHRILVVLECKAP